MGSSLALFLLVALLVSSLLVHAFNSFSTRIVPSNEHQHRQYFSITPQQLEQSQMTTEPSFRLGYVTDVEGNLDYFLSYVQQSQVLEVEECTSKYLRLTLCDHCYFVFGGDAVDKGPGDIRLVRALVDLKRRYPDRVFLLVGNRDLNKLRLTAELSVDDLARPVHQIPPPHWDPKAPSLQEYLQKLQDTTFPQSSLDELNTRVHRLKYLLEHTLGCPKTLEYRRQELSILQQDDADGDDDVDISTSEISDEMLVDSFLYEIENPKGSLRQYLECAQVAVVIGNTLFCHGAVDQQTMRFVPSVDTRFENPTSKPRPAKMVDSVDEWVQALNEYLKRGLEDYTKRPLWNDERTSRGGEALMALQNRPAMWGRSIVSNCYGDGGCITTDHAASIRTDPHRIAMEATNPLVFEKVSSDPRDPKVATWLLTDGIQRVVVGHKPTGDCPAVLSSQYTGVEIVSADTSFSDTSSLDNRGQAMAVVELIGESPTDNHLELRGALRDGTSYQSKHSRLYQGGVDESVGDDNLGRQLDGGWWVKVATEDHYCLTRGKGRTVKYKYLNKAEFRSLKNNNSTMLSTVTD